ncbi:MULTISPECIES: hypothetical protein [Photorhabdus]|uniref:Transposase n=2 Tax=Photorhabdus TaxID=29487 RepID=A0ABX0AW67_9GAMM|nr:MULTISPECIES: hypothetical protein [Photorhabdus]MCT8350744.1 hypothetical protein [Photorhabdus kayaii]MDB6372038.1 hypothetical protein [Photorhabdus bodei]NDL11491.1 hypothetical protein [Photorhabdus kayaii]NDL25036.1 hypothetical protein [Photorhabdus kayaii]
MTGVSEYSQQRGSLKDDGYISNKHYLYLTLQLNPIFKTLIKPIKK